MDEDDERIWNSDVHRDMRRGWHVDMLRCASTCSSFSSVNFINSMLLQLVKNAKLCQIRTGIEKTFFLFFYKKSEKYQHFLVKKVLNLELQYSQVVFAVWHASLSILWHSVDTRICCVWIHLTEEESCIYKNYCKIYFPFLLSLSLNPGPAWTRTCLFFANSVDPDQLASSNL